MNTASRIAAALCLAAALALPSAGVAQTPRTADGKPDLNGYWNGRPPGSGGGGFGFGGAPSATGDINIRPPARGGTLDNFEKDSAVLERSETNKPIYKPEFWDKIQQLDWEGLTIDPTFHCKPAGVPRMGPPTKIVQLGNEIVFLYESGNTFRIMYADGRAHDDVRANDQTWMGDSVARWDGDTLVIDTVGFNDLAWNGWTGYINSTEKRVTEKLRRDGDNLIYEVIYEDPTYLQEPWVHEPIVRRLNRDPKVQLWQDLPCEERDADHIVEKNMRG
jgi:hypothetical protein